MVESWSRLLLGSLLQPEVARDDRPVHSGASAGLYWQHLSSALTVPDIARNAGTSERRLYVLFGQHLNTTPFSHIANLRLNLAIDLLRQRRCRSLRLRIAPGTPIRRVNPCPEESRHLTPAVVRKHLRDH
jgi:AraC-like DNA-binding protein